MTIYDKPLSFIKRRRILVSLEAADLDEPASPLFFVTPDFPGLAFGPALGRADRFELAFAAFELALAAFFFGGIVSDY
jgi:hypothetical protein